LSRRFFGAEKNLPGFFRFREIRKPEFKPKNPYFWKKTTLPQQNIWVQSRRFLELLLYLNSTEFILYNNWQQFGSNRRQKIFGKKPRTPPFYLIFTSENHLNAHSSLIKPHMAMNFAPLDCSCQGASSEPKKIYLDFSVLEKFAKNQKIHIFGSHSKKWVQWVELLLYLNSTHPIQ
jgi:hypothetical protein